MDLIQKASKLGYKHCTEFTIEELDKLPLSDDNKQIEYYFTQKWLREKHNINVLIEFDSISYGYRLIYVDERYTDKVVFEMWDSYEEALETGLQEALKLVPNKK